MQAFGFAKRALEKMYDSTFTVWEFASQEGDSKIVENNMNRPTIKYENKPCRISKRDTGSVDSNGQIIYNTILFCDHIYVIEAGSRVRVTDRNGNVEKYVRSGDPFDSYVNHQEIILNKDSWA